MHSNSKPDPPGQVLDVVVIGEALIDVVTTPEGTTEHPGGSPANIAYGLARLGVQTGLVTSIGTDRRGDALEEHLAGAGVTLLSGARSLERTEPMPKHGTLSRNWYTSAPSSNSATRTPNGSTRRRRWGKPQPTSLGWERTWLSSPRAHQAHCSPHPPPPSASRQ